MKFSEKQTKNCHTCKKHKRHLEKAVGKARNGPTLSGSRPKGLQALDRQIQDCSVDLEQITLSIGRAVGTLQSILDWGR